jgi:integrase/recombinase XerD
MRDNSDLLLDIPWNFVYGRFRNRTISNPNVSLRDDPSEVIKSLESFHTSRLAVGTRRAYLRVVREFFHFVDDRPPLSITADDVVAWRDSLKDHNASSTIAFKLTVIRTLYDYLSVIGHTRNNPASKSLVTPPPLPEKMAGRALVIKEVISLLAGPDRSSPIGARDYALMSLMLRTAMRVSEACSLRASSIRWQGKRRKLTYICKGGWERIIPLPKDIHLAIEEYLNLDKERRLSFYPKDEDPYIFQPCGRYGAVETSRHLSTRRAFNIVRDWAKKAGIGELSPHDLRRTAITTALQQGCSYRHVQMMSGHRQIKTVMIYDYQRESIEDNPINYLYYGDIKDKNKRGKLNTNAVFVRWKRRQLKRREIDGSIGGTVRYAQLVRAMRIDGKPRQKSVAYLSYIRDLHINKTAYRLRFWSDVRRKLKTLKLDSVTHDKIINKLAGDVPIPTEQELLSLRRKYL